MAIGETKSITGTQSYSDVVEFTSYDDTLNVTNATLSLLLPAGDIEMMQGADTLTVTGSTIDGDTGVAIKLGSGDDVVTLQNSTIKSRISLAGGDDIVYINGGAQSTVTINALDPDQTSIDTSEDLTTLSLGSGNDILELNAILAGTGVIRFGDGVDTLVFNAGTLNNTGGMDKLENLTVTSLGGTTHRDIILTGDGNQILWNGNLVGSDNAKWITIEAGSTELSQVDFITASNVVSNVGFDITNRTFTQSDGGTWEISNRANTAITARNSKVTLYNMVLTKNRRGLDGTGTEFIVNNSDISLNTDGGAYLTGGMLSFSDLSFTDNRRNGTGAGVYVSGAAVSGSGASFNGNLASDVVVVDIYTTAGYKPVSATASTTACGGAIFQSGGDLTLTDASFSGNIASSYAGVRLVARWQTSIILEWGTARASATATALGGAIYNAGGELILTSADFNGNVAGATASASASFYGSAIATATAQGGAIFQNGGNLTMTDAGFSGNIATATTTADAVSGDSGRCTATATAQGGAIYNAGGELTLTSAGFSGNIADASASASAYVAASATATAQGGAIYNDGGELTLTSASFSGNIADVAVSAYTPWSATATATAEGGAIYQSGGDLTLTSANFSDNVASALTSACAWAAANATAVANAKAQGGAIFFASGIMNLTDTVFSGNAATARAVANISAGSNNAIAIATDTAQGGAMYVAGGAKLTYTLSDNLSAVLRTVTCADNTADEGGFLYLDNSTADFVIGTNKKLVIADTIAGSGSITKSGADMEIKAAVADADLRWTVASGLLELSTVGRTVNMNNWVIGVDATLRLSNLDDTVNLSTDKKIGTLDLGGGSDILNLSGYHLSDGQLLVTTLTIQGGGKLSSAIRTRDDSAFDITLKGGVTVASTITGGDGADAITIVSGTVTGAMDLGGGADRISGSSANFGAALNLGSGDNTVNLTSAIFQKTVAFGSGNDTLSFTNVTFKDKLVLTGDNGTVPVVGDPTQERNTFTATGTALFEDEVYTGNGYDTLTFRNVTFEKKLDLGAQQNTFTATGTALFEDDLVTGDANDTFNFAAVTIEGDLILGDGDNIVTVSNSFGCNGSITGGSGNDSIYLNGTSSTATFGGMVDLGGGTNLISIQGNVTGNIDFLANEEGSTTVTVYRGASITGNTVSLYSEPGATLRALHLDWSDFADDEAFDKVRILVSRDASFETYEYSFELFNRRTNFTINMEEGFFYQFQANDEDGWAQRYLADDIAPDQVTGVEFNGKTITWDATHDNWGGNGVKQYRVEVATDSNFNNIIESATVSDTEYTLQTTVNTAYYFRVRAEDYSGNTGDWSETATGELDTVAPSRPTGGQSAVNGYGATLSWNAANDTGSGVKEYEYRVGSDSAFSDIVASGTTAELSCSATGLAYGTYYWQVRAVDFSGNIGEWSLSKNFRTADTVAPSAPTDPDFSVEANSVTVIWDGSADDTMGSGLKGYLVQIATDRAFANIVRSVETADAEAVVSGLNDSVYHMRICAEDNAGNRSLWTGTLDFVIGNPDVPTEKLVAGDLNGDGRADIVMTITQAGHGAEGATGAWLIQEDQTAAWGDLSQRNAGWEIFGIGVTNAGKTTNDVYVKSEGNVVGAWVTNESGAVTGWETVGEFDASTQVLGLGDFNGDGQTDLLLRNTNGAVGCHFTSGETLGWNYFQSLGDEWTVCAVGDLNGDGRDDVVLKHDAGFAGSWLTQSDYTMAWANLDTLQEGFSIVGCGDFDGDGTDDVLLQNGGYFGAWLVEDGSVSSWMGLGDIGNVSVEQIADFDADGIDDLRIRTAAGDLGAQLVKGADTLDWKYYGSVGPEWSTSLAAI